MGWATLSYGGALGRLTSTHSPGLYGRAGAVSSGILRGRNWPSVRAPFSWPFSMTVLPRSIVREGQEARSRPSPGGVVGFVHVGGAHGVAPAGVEQDDVGVGADCERALPRVEAHDFRGVGRCEADEIVQGIAAFFDGFGVDQRDARLDAGIEPLGLTITEAADALCVRRQTLNNLVNGKSGISADMAVRVARAFGSDAETWLRL